MTKQMMVTAVLFGAAFLTTVWNTNMVNYGVAGIAALFTLLFAGVFIRQGDVAARKRH